MFAVKAKVRLIAPPPEGQVVERRFAKDDSIEYLVEFQGEAEGLTHQRWFKESALEEMKVSAPAGKDVK